MPPLEQLIILTAILCFGLGMAAHGILRWSLERARERISNARIRERLNAGTGEVSEFDRVEAQRAAQRRQADLVGDAVTHRMEQKLHASVEERAHSVPPHWRGSGKVVGRPLGKTTS